MCGVATTSASDFVRPCELRHLMSGAGVLVNGNWFLSSSSQEWLGLLDFEFFSMGDDRRQQRQAQKHGCGAVIWDRV
jgi:hypothetical protein